MKRTSKSKSQTVSAYYSRLLKIAALTAVVVIGLTGVGTIFGLLFDKAPNESWFSAALLTSRFLFIANAFILLAGGFGIGWLVTRGKGLSKRERTVMAAAYGLIAGSLYFPLSGKLLLVSFSWNTAASGLSVGLMPVITLLAVAAIGAVARYAKISWRRFTMAALITVFWFAQVWTPFQETVLSSRNGDSYAWTSFFSALISPIVLFVLFHVALRRIGRLATAFYATYFTALTATVLMTIWDFDWNNNFAFLQFFEVFDFIGAVIFIGIVVTALVRSRRRT